MQLRAYQSRDIAGIRSSLAGGARPVLSRSPTGSGKTAQLSTGVAVAAARGIRAAILGHQDEIIRQSSKALDEFGVTHGITRPGPSGQRQPKSSRDHLLKSSRGGATQWRARN
jgi:superfamily II DNA or RNA helicase